MIDYTNIFKDKIISIAIEKAFDKIQNMQREYDIPQHSKGAI